MNFTVGSLVKINLKSLAEFSHLVSCFWNEDKTALLNNQKVLCARDGEEVYIKDIGEHFVIFLNENETEDVEFELTHLEAKAALNYYKNSIFSVLNVKEYPEQKFIYQLLDRCLQDCKYFVDICRNPLFLWGKNVDDHILAMRVFYDYLYEKPEWISIPMIDYFELSMKYAVGDKFKSEKLGFSGTVKKVSIQRWFPDGVTERKRALILVQLDSGTENAFYEIAQI